jgi:hypothetical protein
MLLHPYSVITTSRKPDSLELEKWQPGRNPEVVHANIGKGGLEVHMLILTSPTRRDTDTHYVP